MFLTFNVLSFNYREKSKAATEQIRILDFYLKKTCDMLSSHLADFSALLCKLPTHPTPDTEGTLENANTWASWLSYLTSLGGVKLGGWGDKPEDSPPCLTTVPAVKKRNSIYDSHS